MWGAVGKSGSPISRWMTLAPAASMALARASTSKADSVPSLLMRSARGNAVMAVMIRLGCSGSRATRAVPASPASPIRDGHALGVGTRAAAERTTTMPAHAPISPAQQRRAAQVNDLLPLGDWYRHPSLRSWPVLLFLVLICVPSIALVILGGSPSPRTFEHVAWIFAAYFAIAWLLLLGVIVRPDHVTRTMLVVVTVIALATQAPLAIALDAALHGSGLNTRLRLAVRHRPDQPCLLVRSDRLLHRAGRHRPAQVVHGRLDRRGRGRGPARAERLGPGKRPPGMDPRRPGQRDPVPRLREGRIARRPVSDRRPGTGLHAAARDVGRARAQAAGRAARRNACCTCAHNA